MCLQFPELALGPSHCESSQNSENQLPKSCPQLEPQIPDTLSYLALNLPEGKRQPRFEWLGREGWECSGPCPSEESELLSLVHLWFSVCFMTHVAFLSTGDTLEAPHLTNVSKTV